MIAKCISLQVLLSMWIGICFAVPQQNNIPYQKEIDSIYISLNKNMRAEERAVANFELSFYYSFSDSSKGHHFLKEGYLYKNKIPIVNAMGKMYEALFYMDYDIPKALDLLERADQELSKFNTRQSKALRARTLNNIATAYQWQDMQVKMIEVLIDRALPIAIEADDDITTGNIHYKIGLGFWNNIQYGEANRYLSDAISYLKKGKYDPFIMNECYRLLMVSLCATKQDKMANGLLNDFEEFSKKHKGEIPKSDYHFIYAVYYRFDKQYDKALESLNTSLLYSEKEGVTNQEVIGGLYYQRALIYIVRDDYVSALKDLKENVETRVFMPHSFLQDSLNLAYAYMKIYENLGDYKNAMHWNAKKDVIQDTMYQRRIRESIMINEVKYRTLEKESEIQALKIEHEKNLGDMSNTRIIIALVILIFILVGYFLFKNQQKNRRLLHHQEINNLQKLQEEKQKQKLMSLDAMLQGEEKERNRVSRDLHDGLGSVLASIKFKILDLQLNNPSDKVNSVLEDMDFAISEMRRISHNLMPEGLRRFGLEASLSDLCKSMQNAKTKVELQLYGSFAILSMEHQTHIYRIIQELIYNSLKHSEATHIFVQCSMEENVLFITVEDDGIGFALNLLDEESKGGVGLENVKIRVNYLHGKLDIRSEEGKGTSVDIELFV